MSVFNGETDIAKAIESILNQSYRDFEFIIIDDGSIDNSFAIIKRYAEKDERIKIYQNRNNIGLTKSLNKAIKLSKGKFIARQDVDDISLPKRLEKQMDFLIKNPDYAFCGCNGIIKQTKQNLIKFFEKNEILRNLILENCFAHPAIIIRKEIFIKHGLYNEKFLYSQDYELWCRYIYKLRLKAKNLRKKLIIMNMPMERLLEKNPYKFLIQTKNKIKIKLKYLKYVNNKLKVLISVLKDGISYFYVLLFRENKKF